MNSKLFFTCLITLFGMIFWLIFQQGSMSFIAVRIITAFIAACFLILSITWNEKNGWGKGLMVLLVIIGMGSIAHIAFGYGISHYPVATIISMIVLGIGLILYMKFVEPKVLGRKK